jgi:hypothetical protein
MDGKIKSAGQIDSDIMHKAAKGHIPNPEKSFPLEKVVNRFESSFSLFFILIVTFLYFYFPGSSLFSYQENNILFIFSREYLLQFADKPGGLLIYTGNFLTQFYHLPLLGTSILTGLMVMAFILFRELSVILGAKQPLRIFFALLPASILILLQTRYDFHLHDLLGFVVTLTSYILSMKFEGKWRQICVLLVFPVLYYLTGSYSYIYAGLFIFTHVTHEQGSKRFLYPADLILIFIFTWFVSRYLLFYQPSSRLLLFPLFSNSATRLTLYLSLYSLFVIMLPVLVLLANGLPEGSRGGRLARLIGLPALMAGLVALIINTYDPVLSNVLKFEKMAYDQDWDGIIRTHEKIQSTNIVEQYFYNLALSQKGELCNRLFFGRQSYGSMALTLVRDEEHSHRAMYFYYAIGLTGEAHHLAYENMVQHGYHPENIKMLIRTELINGNYKIAERYISVLSNTLFYKDWAEKYNRMLYRPEAVKADRELGKTAALMPAKDFFIETDDFRNLDMLLDANPGNIVAFEYRMARLLLEKDLMETGKEIKKLKSLGYTRIPRHIEEAIISLVNATREFPDLGGMTISSDTDKRFPEYFSDIKSFSGNRQLLEKGIKKVDRSTYWYYLQFGLVRTDFSRKGQADPGIY